jgi:gliding motility-associated-like protein
MIALKKILLSALLCCFTTIVLAQNITVDDSKTAADLVNILTNNSSCLTLSGQTVKGDTFTSGKNSYGSFDAGTSGFPFTKGIVLSTWSATNSVGPFVNNHGDLSTWSGDADLQNILGITTVNATVLEFDFIPQTNFISFNYLFASNEYQKEFPCNYSDGFAFLIKEKSPGSSYSNMALIPGTTTPVSSQNIHPTINSSGTVGGTIYNCPAINGTYFSGFNTTISPINYAGQTIPMTAEANVTPGNTYHIKLVVADNQNAYYNSAVFLDAGSFSSKIDFGIDRLLTTNNPVCFGDNLTLDSGLTGSANTFKWFKDGTTTVISTSSTYTVTDLGTYNVEASIAGCGAKGQIKIEYAPEIKLNNTILQSCDTGGSTFDLTKKNTDIIGINTDIKTIEYFENNTSGVLSNTITNPTAYLGTNGQTVYAKLTNKYNCSSEGAEIKLQIIPISLATTSATQPTIHDFAGNSNSVQLIPPSTGGSYEYSLDGTNYQTSPLFSNLAVGNYTAYIRDSSNCQYLTYPLMLLDYPRFFTPNGDGYNDVWKIKNLDLFSKATVSIFDRYGKLLKQLDSGSSWDGKYIGNELPATDYWFNLNFSDGKIIKGHFSLKR